MSTPNVLTLAPAGVGDDVRAAAAALGDGDILVLENVRFEPGETENDPQLAAAFRKHANLN